MENTSREETVTASLLEEVFTAVELLKESEKYMETNSKTGPSFLAEEYSSDLSAALGKPVALKKKTAALKESNTGEHNNDRSFIDEDENNDSADPDPFREGEGTKWITSTTNLNSSLNKPSNYFCDGTPKNGKKWADFKSFQEKLSKTIDGFESPKGGTLVDPVFCMNIINPKVSSVVLKARMSDRMAVPPFKIKNFLTTTDVKDVNWVTGGVIIRKFITKSQKGNPYCIWTLTDLHGDIKTITVFLFGSAYKEYWKLTLGAVIGILNPSVLENKNDKSEATLRVDRSDSIMLFGDAKDYGICKSKKNNGENCTAVVNKAKCEYCIYHVKQVYEKASRRPELQANFTGKGLSNLRNKVLGKDEVFYAGKLYTAFKGTAALVNSRRKLESQRIVPEGMDVMIKVKKDRELLKRLNGEIQTFTKSKTVCETGKVSNTSKSPSICKSDNVASSSKLGEKAVSKPKMIDLDRPITKEQILRARANAIELIRKKGPLKKPEDGRSCKRTPEQIKALKRKIEEEEEQRKRIKTGEDCENSSQSALRKKLEKSGITSKFLELMNAPIKDTELLKEAENEEREKYFNKLEFREKLEEKMATTYKVDCKAVRCLKCHYKSFSASELCKKERHPLKVVKAVKRFWKCGDCSTRTVCLELVPLHSCKTCGSSKWEKTTMLPEKKAHVLPNEKLSIRGHEEKFLGSSTRNSNINLLVPDEES